MKRFLAVIVISMTAAASLCSQAKMVKNFDQLMFALRTGSEVRVVIFYARCRLVVDTVETKAPDEVGGMSFNTFEYFGQNSVKSPKAFVTTSQLILISHPKYGQVYHNVRLKIYDDNTVEVNARYLSPTTYQVVMDETFYGKVSSGDDGNAVCLYER
jgi:hypothetical protein